MINRRHKDTVFRDLFGAPERRANALELYNALNNTTYANPDDLELTTIDDVIYMGVKNDISFIVDDELVLWEHQSTYNPNMPLRGLVYFSKLYSAYLDRHGLNAYGSRRLELPTPRYVVFYIGEEGRPDAEVMRLSDSFVGGAGDVEVTATAVNINAGRNAGLLGRCKTLRGYARLVELIRENRDAGMGMEDAVDAAVRRCIGEGVLADYLSGKRAEVSEMFMTEYDEAKTMAMFKEEGRAEGRAEGMAYALRGLMASSGVDAAAAMDMLGIAPDERDRYAELLTRG